MAKCSKCGFVIATELLAGHEFLCGGTVRETPELPPFPPPPIIYKPVLEPYSRVVAERYAWEARCRLAVETMYHAKAMANGQAYDSIEDLLRSILLMIGPLPEKKP